MGEFKGTQGPWNGNATIHVAGCHKVGLSLAFLNTENPARRTEAEANARLIAAAPELLEALIWFVENDETNEGDTPIPEYGNRTWDEMNDYWIDGKKRAGAAIAKALGEAA